MYPRKFFFAVSAFYLLISACGSSSDGQADGQVEGQAVELAEEQLPNDGKSWLAGDHHIHSVYSVWADESVDPPALIVGGDDATHTTLQNAQMARKHGLSWMVTTDHGEANHSKLNLEQAYPALVDSREAVSDLIQFYGMELDTPGAKHSTLIIPHTHDEAERLYQLEKAYSRYDAYPFDPARDTEERMLEALTTMRNLPAPPIVIVNHPSRTAPAMGEYTLVTPRELRDWNDTAPAVAVGMEGSPGHQAAALNADGSANFDRMRGDYDDFPTMGGFDQMTARVGGFWDSMLGEGRGWWITSTSDSHIHYTEGDEDFWPGEYAKTYVYAERTYDDILHGLRNGHVFVTTGDLVSELYVTAEAEGGDSSASIGDTLHVASGSTVRITVKFRDPDGLNANNENPAVARLDVITGLVTGAVSDRTQDTNATTVVAERFTSDSWKKEGAYTVATYVMENVTASGYVRVRGTNGTELEPQQDVPGENPWTDLWFYSNPISITVE